jgi:hypothetical protein
MTFHPTHQLIAPAGEEIPVLLVPELGKIHYLVITEVEYEEGTAPFYRWHPLQGVTYNGIKLEGLKVLPLESALGKKAELTNYESNRNYRGDLVMI